MAREMLPYLPVLSKLKISSAKLWGIGRPQFIPSLLLFLFSTLVSTAQPATPLSATEILQRMDEAGKRVPTFSPYSEVRRYVLRNIRFKRRAEMRVRVIHRPESPPHFEVLQVAGSEDVHRRVFEMLLEGEAELSRHPPAERSLTSSNYDVELLGTETISGRLCHVLKLVPRRKSRYLLQGRAWIDTASFGLVRLEGRPTMSLSFWVGKPLIVQEFREVRGVWVAADSHTTASTKLLGTTELIIERREHQTLPHPPAVAAVLSPRPLRAAQ
jgi:hypothetical protein